MADRLQTAPAPPAPGSEPTVTSLLSGIVKDAEELVKQQLLLFRHELMADVTRAKEGLPSLGAGVVLVLAAILFLGTTVALLITWAAGGDAHFPLWVSFLIVTAVYGLAGLGLLYFAKKNLESLGMSKQATEATKENVEWLTKPK
jgi:hypothetical protein